MNKPTLLLAGLLALSGVAAQAEELYAPASFQAPAEATVTRADVRQELARARAAGELTVGDVDYPRTERGATRKSRADVRAETRGDIVAARKAGHVIDRSGN